MALVIHTSTGKQRKVKNLGWLLANWRNVQSFSVARLLRDRYGARLVAHMDDGRAFVTDFASSQVLACWLNRPVFRGAEINWFGKTLRIDDNLCRTYGTAGSWARAFSG